jgi:hypothetical protein
VKGLLKKFLLYEIGHINWDKYSGAKKQNNFSGHKPWKSKARNTLSFIPEGIRCIVFNDPPMRMWNLKILFPDFNPG